MILGSLARRYAKAILAMAVEKRSHEKYNTELESLSSLYNKNEEFRSALENAAFPLSQRQKVLHQISQRLTLSPAILNLCLLLLSRGKISYLPKITKEYGMLLDKYMGRIRGKMTTVAPLDLAAELRMKTVLERISGQKVILEKAQDSRLIGGFILQVGDVVYDGSVFTQLQYLRKRLSADAEIF